jgi:hypothetical protein
LDLISSEPAEIMFPNLKRFGFGPGFDVVGLRSPPTVVDPNMPFGAFFVCSGSPLLSQPGRALHAFLNLAIPNRMPALEAVAFTANGDFSSLKFFLNKFPNLCKVFYGPETLKLVLPLPAFGFGGFNSWRAFDNSAEWVQVKEAYPKIDFVAEGWMERVEGME